MRSSPTPWRRPRRTTLATAVDPDRLAELEEERGFLLRSLADLEREYEAGDVDEVDYLALKDGYTARAAATLRALEDGRSALPGRPPANWPRRVVGAVVIAALIGVVWWALAASSAQRLPGQQISGLDPRDERATLYAEARAVELSDPAAAANIYAEILESEPEDPQALTYRGWALARSATSDVELREAIDSLRSATEIDPSYPDPHCFLGIVFNQLGQPDLALPRLDECLASDPPAEVRGLVESLRADVAADQ
jgi:tetratricopeptide (TPR) repeat protein